MAWADGRQPTAGRTTIQSASRMPAGRGPSEVGDVSVLYREPRVHPGVEPAGKRPDTAISAIDEHARHTGG